MRPRGLVVVTLLLGLALATLATDHDETTKEGAPMEVTTLQGDPVNVVSGALEPLGPAWGDDGFEDSLVPVGSASGDDLLQPAGRVFDDMSFGNDAIPLLSEASVVDGDSESWGTGEAFVGEKCGDTLLGPDQVCCDISGKLFATTASACEKSKGLQVPESMPVRTVKSTGGAKPPKLNLHIKPLLSEASVVDGDSESWGTGEAFVGEKCGDTLLGPDQVCCDISGKLFATTASACEKSKGLQVPESMPVRTVKSTGGAKPPKLNIDLANFAHDDDDKPPLPAPRPDRDVPFFADQDEQHEFPAQDVIPDVMKSQVTRGDRYEFGKDSEGMEGVEVEVKKYVPGEQNPASTSLVTPEQMLELLEDDTFMDKIVGSLKNIYAAKFHKYEGLLKTVREQVISDMKEKQKMEEGGISKKELEKTFPMLTVNLGLKIKVKKLKRKAGELYRALENATTAKEKKAIRNVVRENFKRAINDESNGIQSVTGKNRQHIRNQLATKLYILSRGFRPFMDSFMNMLFVGDAGVGKTKLANVVGFVFQQSGVLLEGTVKIVSPKDLVGEYVGQTAGKTAGVLMGAIESVVFVDEAYQIMPCTSEGTLDPQSGSFGPESITEIVNYLDKYIGLSVMIVAGYEKEMNNCFMAANSGLPRRFPTKIILPKYTTTDLLNIFLNVASKKLGKAYFDEPIARYIYTVMSHIREANPSTFQYQAGDVMNLVSNFLNVVYGSWTRDWFAGGTDVQVDMINDTFNEYLRNKGFVVVTSGDKVALQKLAPAKSDSSEKPPQSSVEKGGVSKADAVNGIPDDVVSGASGKTQDSDTEIEKGSGPTQGKEPVETARTRGGTGAHGQDETDKSLEVAEKDGLKALGKDGS